MPRFDQSFNGLREQNLQETQQLKQRYLDGKNKRVPKTKDKKQTDSIQSSVHVQKFLKRCIDDQDAGGGADEPPVKLQCTAQHQGHQHQPDGGLTKFSVEIVQQLEFTTSSASSQPQQISTNVTVKAHTNASVKSDVASPKAPPNADAPCPKGASSATIDVANLAECVKQEPDYEFADLDQCAAALEKDAVVNGVGFGGCFGDIMGDDAGDEIMSSDALKDLISDITNCSEFMKEFDFDDKSELMANGGLKVEDLKADVGAGLDGVVKTNLNSPLGQTYSPPVYEQQGKSRVAPSYPNMDFSKTELSPAAQTLKQMAEQHQQQHKNQMGGIAYGAKATPTSRSPYHDFPLADYGSPNSGSSGFHKGSPGFAPPDAIVKQEMLFQSGDYDGMKRKGAAGMYKQQQYSPYGSPSANHGSPGYLPGRNGAGGAGAGGGFGAGTPPTPPSGAAGGATATLQINQAQQLHISQQTHGGHSIQVSAGQHLHLSGDLKGNVSIAAQQGMHFTQHAPSPASNPSQSQPSGQNQSQGGQSQAQHANPMQGNLNVNNGGNSAMGPNTTANTMHSPGINTAAGNAAASAMQNGMQNVGMSGGSIVNNGMQPNGNMVMMGLNGMNPQGHLGQQNPLGDSYSLSQSQTINFTQQTLRQRGVNGLTGNMGSAPNQFGMPAASSMGVRQINPQALEHQKLLQQQQLLRQQQQQQQQQHVRPPPPDYKSSAMLQNMQSRFPNSSNIRRMPHQSMPPSGPMIMRPQNMYMSQQQHISRGMYRPQSNMTMEAMPQPGTMEWRHMLMSQQQSATFNQQIRPNFQGFNVNNGNMPMNTMQSQQFRMQRAMVGGTIHSSQGLGMGQSPVGMGQMNSMNQMMHMQQQQSVMQQSNNQMSMNTLHMQQTQSINISGQSMQQSTPPAMGGQLLPSAASAGGSSVNSFSQPTNDFSLEFLENLPGTDTGPFSEQDLLNSFDNDSGFNLQDIL